MASYHFAFGISSVNVLTSRLMASARSSKRTRSPLRGLLSQQYSTDEDNDNNSDKNKARMLRPAKRSRGSTVPSLSAPKHERKSLTSHQDTIDIENAPPTHAEAWAILTALQRHFESSSSGNPSTRTMVSEQSILDSLVHTILSQATTRQNCAQAFEGLKERFPTWIHAESAGADRIAAAIRPAGLARQKSIAIHNILATLFREQAGDLQDDSTDLSLEYLRTLSDASVKQQLLRFKGVGVKTASCVLMFAMGRPDFPVDTHVRRIVSRLGWVGSRNRPNPPADDVYGVLNVQLPDGCKYDLHVLLIELGRSLCKARNPMCRACPLQESCFTGREITDAEKVQDE